MTDKPILLFDIDKTLFDTSAFSHTYQTKLISYLKISPTKFAAIHIKYRSSLKKHTDYRPSDFLKHLINSLHLANDARLRQKLTNLYFARENFSRHLFPDVFPTLNLLKSTHRLGIYSEGFASFQKTKLVKSGLIDFLDPQLLFIHRRKENTDLLSSLPPHATIVDDNLEVIKSLTSQSDFSLTPIWLNRDHLPAPSRIRTIHSLTELV